MYFPFILLFFLPLVLSSPKIQILNRSAQKGRAGHYILRYHDHVTSSELLAHEKLISQKLGRNCTTTYDITTFKGCHLETDEAGLTAIASPAILSYELDSLFSVSPISSSPIPNPNPPNYFNSSTIARSSNSRSNSNLITEPGVPWGLTRISHKTLGTTGDYVFDASACAGTTIYVIDTGIRISHVEFGGRARWGSCFVPGVLNSNDDHGHGSHCAGTAVGSSVGVCKQAQVVGVKVLDSTGFGYNTWIIAGIQWAVNDALSNPNTTQKSVISISLGGGYSPTLNAAVTAAVAASLPVIVAAGNNAQSTSLFSPSSALNAIVVGATDINDNRASFSNVGKGVSVWAPGVGVFSAWNGCDVCYGWVSGTSQATPHVTGLAAYLMTLDGLSTPSKILSKIRSLATRGAVVGTLGGASNKLAYNGNGA